MTRLSGQDASFLYSETPTVLMHTLKIQIFDSPYAQADYTFLRGWLESALDAVPMLRQRVVFGPWHLHHPVLVDDPDFDLESHIYRAALPAPGGRAEFDQMISQIMCHRLDRQRPLWELWAISGLAGGKVAIVHKIHHCLADGAATVRYLSKVFERHAKYDRNEVRPSTWSPEPLPSARRLVWEALRDHLVRDIRNLPAFLAGLWRATLGVLKLNRSVGSPTVDTLAHPPPRTRLNHALSARRSFTTRQVSLDQVRMIGQALKGTVNDVVLAISAGALREYLLTIDDLPGQPLTVSVPVSADEPGVARESGNRTTYFSTRLWTNLADPLERFYAIRRSTDVGKQELDVMGRSIFVELMQYLPPAFSIWKAHHKQRLRVADQADYHPMTNMIVSNVPGPRERVSGNYGVLEDIYSMGPLVEGCGLNITAWSYAGNLNVSMMGCKRAVPDIDRLAEFWLQSMEELDEVAQDSREQSVKRQSAENRGPDNGQAESA